MAFGKQTETRGPGGLLWGKVWTKRRLNLKLGHRSRRSDLKNIKWMMICTSCVFKKKEKRGGKNRICGFDFLYCTVPRGSKCCFCVLFAYLLLFNFVYFNKVGNPGCHSGTWSWHCHLMTGQLGLFCAEVACFPCACMGLPPGAPVSSNSPKTYRLLLAALNCLKVWMQT